MSVTSLIAFMLGTPYGVPHPFIRQERIQATSNLTDVPATRDADRRALDQLFDVLRTGDSSLRRWICYVDGLDVFNYGWALQPEQSNLRYFVRIVDGQPLILYQGQTVTPKYLVKPDNYIRVEALTQPRDLSGDLTRDNSTSYIEAVTYRDDQDELEIVGSRSGILDVALQRLSLGQNTKI